MIKHSRILTSTALGLSFIGGVAQANTFHVGLGGGYATGNAKTQSSFDVIAGAGDSKNHSVNGASGQIFASWEKTVSDNILLGLEISGELSGASSEEKRSVVGLGFHTLKISYRSAADVAFKIGYQASETVSLYLKTGLSFAQWEMESTNTANVKKSQKKNLWGFRPTIGVRVGISESVSASLEYSHGFYQKMKLNHAEAAAAGGALRPAEFKTTPRIGTIMGRLSYKL